MAHYYGQVNGAARTPATRRGHKNTGITARADSYTVGARVSLSYSEHIDADIVTLYATTGSGDSYGSRIMSYAIIDGTFTILDTSYPEVLL